MTQRTVQVQTGRVATSLLIGLLCAWLAAEIRSHRDSPSDFAQVHAAARALVDGRNPYEEVGPDKRFRWGYPLLYPFTAITATLPLAGLERRVADPLVVFLGTALLAWCAWTTPTLYWCFPSFAMIASIGAVQWAPLFTAATFLPPLGFLWICKPNLGLAYFLAYPSWTAAFGGVLLIALSLMLFPMWPITYWAIVAQHHAHLSPPLLRWGGPALLLAWIGWRRPEVRLFALLAFVPTYPQAYDALPVFLLAQTHTEGAILAATSWLMFYGNLHAWPGDVTTMPALYLPALAMVLRQEWRRLPRLRSAGHGRLSTP